jgi:Transport protein Avl9
MDKADYWNTRGPEVETWFGVPEGTDPTIENDWAFLPFMALSDGAHAYVHRRQMRQNPHYKAHVDFL